MTFNLDRIRDWPITRKLILITMFSSSMALLIAAGELIVYDVLQSRAALEAELRTTAAITADNVISAVTFQDSAAVAESLQALGSNPNVIEACVYQGTQLLGSFTRDHSAACAGAAASIDRMMYSDGRLTISRAITSLDGKRIGTLVVRVSTVPLRNRILRDLLNIALVIVFAGGLAFVLSSRLQRWISDPLLQLTALTRAVSSTKDYSLRASRGANDEFGVLVKAVNEMLAEIEAHSAEREAVAREREELLEREQLMRKAAEDANRIKDEFLATLSHELRTPLNSIVGWATLISNRSLPPDKFDAGAKAIERNARAQARLIEDLLDVSRIATGKFRLEESEVTFEEFVAAAVEIIRPIADARQIRLETHLSDARTTLLADPARLQQALGNVLDNAVKFTPAGGQVTITSMVEPDLVRVTVTDTGVGIPAEFLPFVFDRLRQGDGSTTRQFGGLGIGMALARHIVDLHGGTISVMSGGRNRGATFTMTIPRIRSESRTNGLPFGIGA